MKLPEARGLASQSNIPASEDFEVDLCIQLDEDWPAAFHCGIELVLLHRLYGLLIHALADSAEHTHMLGPALLIDPQVDEYGATDLVLLCLFGELGRNGVDEHRRRDLAADFLWHDAGGGLVILRLGICGIVQLVVDGDGRLYFSRLAVEQVGLECPLPDGADSAGPQLIGAADNSQCLDCSVLRDDDVKDNSSLHMGGFGIRVTKPEDIRPALEKARDSGMPALVDVVINRDVYSSGTSNQTMYK